MTNRPPFKTGNYGAIILTTTDDPTQAMIAIRARRMNAEECRETAHFLNQLAETLDGPASAPQPDADGWIENTGTYPGYGKIETRARNGKIRKSQSSWCDFALNNLDNDIVTYRWVKP